MCYKRVFAIGAVVIGGALTANAFLFNASATLPDLAMPETGLKFSVIEGYWDYRIVATHYRTDKKELRYILANDVAYDALKGGVRPLPEGSKVVKIGWTVNPMPLYPDALEADALQRVEYMVKDSGRFDQDGDHWGYARFIKKGGAYESWQDGAQGCISCHSAASANDFLFTTLQKIK